MSHIATCSCGQLKVTYNGEFARTAVCHCFDCQKRTGSAFGYQTRVETAKIVVEGKSTVFQKRNEGLTTFHFCPTCGSTVYWNNEGLPGSTIIAIGNFTDPTLPGPTFMVYGNRKHHWVNRPDTAIEYF